jgi:hypothetical protein
VAKQQRDGDSGGYVIRRNVVELKSAGDVILFLAGGDWWHGMMPVSKADGGSLVRGGADLPNRVEERFHRVAVGMLQPL